MTEFELKSEVHKFYNGYINTDKALKLYEIEYGFKPELDEDDLEFVNDTVFNKYQLQDCVTVEAMSFMKKLQNSGKVNMITESVNAVETQLLVTKEQALYIVSAYIQHYNELYYPEKLV